MPSPEYGACSVRGRGTGQLFTTATGTTLLDYVDRDITKRGSNTSIMCTKMLLLCGFVCLLSAPDQARGSDAAQGTEQVIDKDVGISHAFVIENPSATLRIETISFILTDQCPAYVQRWTEKPKSEVALRPAQNKPSLRAAGLLRPGWRGDGNDTIYISYLRASRHIQALQTGLSSGGPGLMCS